MNDEFRFYEAILEVEILTGQNENTHAAVNKTAVLLGQLKCSRTPFVRTLVIRIANYPDRLGPSCKYVENSTKLTCLGITGYRVKYSKVLWLLELQIRRGRKVYTQVKAVFSNSRTSNSLRSLFSKKNSIIRIFCISGWIAFPINPDKWRYT